MEKTDKHYKSILAVGHNEEVCILDYGNYPYKYNDIPLREIFEEYYFDNGIDLPKRAGIYEFEYDYWEWSESTESGSDGDSGGKLISCKILMTYEEIKNLTLE